MSELDTFLAEVTKEGSDPFVPLEKETPSESLPEKEPEADQPKEGDNTPTEEDVPFHKHPRWIERENELKVLREKEEENARVIAELSTFKEEVADKLKPQDPVPDEFVKLFGDNPEAYKVYKELEDKRKDEIKREIIAEQQQVQQRAQEETTRWNKWVDDEITKLQTEGKQFDRNELIKTMLEYRPTDERNNFDFQAGFRIYEALKAKDDPAKSIARKQLADTATHATTTGEKKPKDFLTPADLRNKSWHQL